MNVPGRSCLVLVVSFTSRLPLRTPACPIQTCPCPDAYRPFLSQRSSLDRPTWTPLDSPQLRCQTIIRNIWVLASDHLNALALILRRQPSIVAYIQHLCYQVHRSPTTRHREIERLASDRAQHHRSPNRNLSNDLFKPSTRIVRARASAVGGRRWISHAPGSWTIGCGVSTHQDRLPKG